MTQADIAPVRRAILSVSDKSSIVDFAKRLSALGVELVSTGGTASLLRDSGLMVKEVSDLTGFPEMMDGRVKTLHPGVHGGLLAKRDNAEHMSDLKEHGLSEIDLLVVNLYPFQQTVMSGADYETCIENIDIGGPAMVRAAAKNHESVSVIVDSSDYDAFIEEIEISDGVSFATRRKLAAKAYQHTASYDSLIGSWFADVLEDKAPSKRSFSGSLMQALRYGENPHQAAAFYSDGTNRPGVSTARQIQGKELSYNNINDTNAAFELVSELPSDHAAVAIIKHANPCGVAIGATPREAYDKALKCDPVSAFGGIVALNCVLDQEVAERISEVFTEVVIAPAIEDDALKVFSKKKNLRLLITGDLPSTDDNVWIFTQVSGGFLAQTKDTHRLTKSDLKCVTERQPDEQEVLDMLLAFTIAKHVKSNAIVYVKEGASVGIGAGQMSRIDSARIASQKSIEAAKSADESSPLTLGSVVASDAFFPFADGLLAAAEAGVTAVIQPGGSVRDQDVIEAANEAGLAMVFTGIRHFRH